MASMEELNNEELAAGTGWAFDKKVPITLILVVIVQIITTTWGAAVLSTNVENYGRKIVKIEIDLANFIEKADGKYQSQVVHLEERSNIRRELDMIEADMADIQERVREIERNGFTQTEWKNFLRMQSK